MMGEETGIPQDIAEGVPQFAEKLASKRFDRVVIGHDEKDLDADAFLCWYLTLKAGKIEASTPVEFANKIPLELWKDPTVAIIEGGRGGGGGKWDNQMGLGTPAALEAWSDVQTLLPKGLTANMRAVVDWVQASDERGIEYQGTLDANDLQYVLGVGLRGLTAKHTGEALKQKMVQLAQVLDSVVEGKFDKEHFKQAFSGDLQAGQDKLQRDRVELQRLLAEEGSGRVWSSYGERMGMVALDLRGTEISTAGMGAVRATAGRIAQERGGGYGMVAMVLTDGEDGGVVVKIDARHARGVDIGELIQRLDEAELQYGSGRTGVDEAKAGGHKRFAATRRPGTQVNMADWWMGLQDVLNDQSWGEREVKEARWMEDECRRLDGRFNAVVEMRISPDHVMGKKMMKIVDPRTQQEGWIPQSQVVDYQAAVSDGAQLDDLLSEVVVGRVHPKIQEMQSVRAREGLVLGIEKGDVYGAMEALALMKKEEVLGLVTEQLVQLVELVSRSEVVMEAIWNGHSKRYWTGEGYVIADWARNNPEQMGIQKYRYENAASLIDDAVINACLERGDEHQVRQVYEAVEKIAQSKALEKAYAQVMIGEKMYPISRLSLWQRVARGELAREDVEKTLLAMAAFEEAVFSPEKWEQHRLEYERRGLEPTMTLLLELGDSGVGKEMMDAATHEGLAIYGGNEGKVTLIGYEASIALKRPFSYRLSEDDQLTAAVRERVEVMRKADGEVPLTIFMGRMAISVSLDVGAILADMKAGKVNLIFWDQELKRYFVKQREYR